MISELVDDCIGVGEGVAKRFGEDVDVPVHCKLA